jgi:hypothetical protein
MSIIKTLFENKYLTVVEKETESHGKYVYATTPYCKSVGIGVLVYEFVGSEMYIFGRYEVRPCHSEELELASITGAYDNSDKYTLRECVINELKEEAGLIVPEELLISLGQVRTSKLSDETTFLFAVDFENKRNGKIKTCKPTTDGGLLEKDAYCMWVHESKALWSKDPLLATMVARVKSLPI